MNSKVKEGESEKIGLVPGDFLKRYETLVNENHNQVANNEDCGIVSSDAILGGVADPSMLYVAVEDYETEHPCQISFSKGTQLVVIEVCKDGKHLELVLNVIITGAISFHITRLVACMDRWKRRLGARLFSLTGNKA